MAAAGPEPTQTGPAVLDAVSQTINNLWCGKPKDLAKTFDAHLRPSNVVIHKVELDESLLDSIQSHIKRKDVRLKLVQGGIATAAVAATKTIDQIVGVQSEATQDDGMKLLLTHLLGLQTDVIKVLSYANMTVNNIRREGLKPGLQEKYKPLAKDTLTVDSPYLFSPAPESQKF